MPGIFRRLLSLLLIVLSVLGLINVYSDNADVVKLASDKACPGCEPHLVQSGRSPIAQTLTFQIAPAQLVVVECRRAFIFVGEYGCSLPP
jgi:hypothetical protein